MINVLAVDDSALVRKVIGEIIESAPDMHLVAAVHDPIFAIEQLKNHDVDVIVLDIEMPRMNGLVFLEKLMRVNPITVIILSSLTKKNAQLTLNAFELGAFDVLSKPDDLLALDTLSEDLLRIIRYGSTTDVKQKLLRQFQRLRNQSNSVEKKQERKEQAVIGKTTDKVVLLGASTGGTTAISDILSSLPADFPGLVIVQHMPKQYTESFAERLNKNSKLTVKIAEDGERILMGTVYISPGELHCSVRSSGAKYYIQLHDGPRVNYHKPSVTPLFQSGARFLGANAIGVMLTGMGEDGSMAMREMKEAGSYNIIQDEESSIVWGMPGKAFEYGAGDVVLPLKEIAAHLCKVVKN